MKPFLNNFWNIFSFRRQTARLSARQALFAVLGAVFVLSLLIFPYHSAHAKWTVASIVGGALSYIFGLVFAVLGWVLSSLIGALVSIAEYNKIINQGTVVKAWTTVRDIVNMFFIFAMLLIAFSTILRYQQYEVKKMLPKLVLYAVLVNFSLTICGLFIDIAQVFTLTFVNAFKDGAINNFVTVTQLFTYSKLENVDISTSTVLGGYIMALVLLVVTLVTIGAMFLILLVRIAYLWILSILSPFAFVLPVIPGGQKYASQWWDMFSKQVITGPLLAFFIWLSLSILSGAGNIGNEILNSSGKSAIAGDIGRGGIATVTLTGVATTQADFLINYVIAIAMMFIGLMLTSQMGGAAGKIAGGASSRMQGAAKGVANWTRRRIGPTGMIVGGAAVLTGGASLGLAAGGALLGKYAPRLGGWGLRNSALTRNTLVGRWAQDRYDRRRENNERARQRFMEQRLGMGDRTFERLSDRSHQWNIPVRPGTSRLDRIKRFIPSMVLGTTFGAANRATQVRRDAQADANAAATTGISVKNNNNNFNRTSHIGDAGDWYRNNGLPERRFHTLDFTNADSASLYLHALKAPTRGRGPNVVPTNIKQAMINAMTQYVATQTERGGVVNRHVQGVLNNNRSGLGPEANLRSAFMTSINQKMMQQTMAERERLGLGEVPSEDLVKTAEAAKIDRDFAVRQKTPAREIILERMRQGESPDDIINSVKNYEEKVAKGEYYNEERVNDVKRQQKAYEEWEKNGDVNKMTGIDRSERDVSKGRSAQLAVNFDDETLKGLDLQGAGGAYISGENKQSAVDALSEYLYKQLSIDNAKKDSGQQKTDEDIVKEVEQFKQMLQQAKGVALINKAQTGLGADERSLHEKFHRNFKDVDQGQMMGAWNAMPEEERKNAEEKIRGTIKGGKDMPLEEVVEEYLVEGLTNATGRGRGATKLDQKTLDQFEQMGIVRKIDQKTTTGEMRTIYRPTKEAAEEKTELERKLEDKTQAKPHTLTERAAQEEKIEITGDEEIEGKEEKEEAPAPEEKKKEEKVVTEQTVSKAPEASYREPDTQKEQIESVAKHMNAPDAKFFRLMFSELSKTVGRLGSVVVGSQAGQTRKLAKYLEELNKAKEHIKSKNPLEQKASQQEFDIKLNEFKEEFKEYDIINEAPSTEQGSSQEDIEKAINDLSNKS